METLMPVFFIGHGSPMNAIEENEFSLAWRLAGQQTPRPRAIVCVSAHWETRGTQVTAMPKPRTIHDFGGFPRPLFEMEYPAPGAPDLAEQICRMITLTETRPDLTWGLDHGTWSVLSQMFPKADIPVIQLSLDRTQESPFHYELGRQLADLRYQGVLIVGSGNIVHNLRLMVWQDVAYDWATDFDAKVRHWIVEDDHEPLVHYEKQGQSAALSINTAEHYLPLLYVLGLKKTGEPVSFFADKLWGGSLSMRSVRVG